MLGGTARWSSGAAPPDAGQGRDVGANARAGGFTGDGACGLRRGGVTKPKADGATAVGNPARIIAA